MRELDEALAETEVQHEAAARGDATVAEKLDPLIGCATKPACWPASSATPAVRRWNRCWTPCAQALGEHVLTVESADKRERDMHEFLQGRIDAEGKKIDRLRDAIILAMQNYVLAWPLNVREVDVNIEAVGGAEPGADLRDFQHDLRSCAEVALTGSPDEEYIETRFLQVRRIIERFRGREGSAELGKRCARKVTDVRN